jgi:hypothetical protein
MQDKDYTQIQVGGPRAKRHGIALVDVADAGTVGAYHWSMSSDGYAKRNTKGLTVYLHRFLLGLLPGDGHHVDHVSGDTLDNRRVNLRVATNAQNHQNLYRCGPYRGVTWHTEAKRWKAQVKLTGKNHHLGYFATRDEAAEVAAAYRREHMPFSADARAG